MMTHPDHRREAERLLAAGIDGGTWYQTHPADEAQARRDCVAAAHTHATLAVADAVAALGEIWRLRDVAAAYEQAAATVAADAIGLFLEYRDTHGHDEAAAQVNALTEVHEGLRAIDDLSHYQPRLQTDSREETRS